MKTTTGSINPVATPAKIVQAGEKDFRQTVVKQIGDIQRPYTRVTTTLVNNMFNALTEATTEELFNEINQHDGNEIGDKMQGLEAP